MSVAWSIGVEVVVSLLLLVSGALVLTGAFGLLRMPDFFQRMHPPALGFTLGTWCVGLASMLYFSVSQQRLAWHGWLIIVLLSITVPITTILLARAALFRQRVAQVSALPGAQEKVSKD